MSDVTPSRNVVAGVLMRHANRLPWGGWKQCERLQEGYIARGQPTPQIALRPARPRKIAAYPQNPRAQHVDTMVPRPHERRPQEGGRADGEHRPGDRGP